MAKASIASHLNITESEKLGKKILPRDALFANRTKLVQVTLTCRNQSHHQDSGNCFLVKNFPQIIGPDTCLEGGSPSCWHWQPLWEILFKHGKRVISCYDTSFIAMWTVSTRPLVLWDSDLYFEF